MKRETLRHPKTHDLAARLGCSRPEAIGYLTLLWEFTADMAIQGDVGKWPDGAIARSCDYMGDAEAFVAALVDAGWLDRCDCHRLVVHDWPDHCERWVRAKMGKAGLGFVDCGITAEPSKATLDGTTEPTTEPTVPRSPPRDRTEPNRTEPIPAGPVGAEVATAVPANGSGSGPAVPTVRFVEVWPEAITLARQFRRLIDKWPDKPGPAKDRELAAKAACMAKGAGLEPSFLDVAESINRGDTKLDKPWAYFRKAVIRIVNERYGAGSFDSLWRQIEIPPEVLNPQQQEATA